MSKTSMGAILALLMAVPLSACGGGVASEGEAKEHGAAAEAEKGPNRGRMLRDGDFAIELVIFEDGHPPQFRAWATRAGKPLDAAAVQLSVTLRRLDGEVNRFAFQPRGAFLAGQGTVEEPHSFNVEVVAVADGKRHAWSYASPEGRTRIAAEAARTGGIVVEKAGPATIGEERELFGTVQLAPSARSEIRGQFPGRIVRVTKAVGDFVRRGELLARIESSESLQVYPVYATTSGVVVERNGNPGDVAADRALYVIADPAQTTVVFNVFPRDLTAIRPGMRVSVETMDGQAIGVGTLGGYLAEGNAAAGTALMRVAVANPGGRLAAGMAMRGRVTVDAVTVPLAVRTEAIQPFRDFKVVFANYGADYEVRMLELGRSSPEWTEVISGLKPGTPYAAKGSFLIRADIEKSGASHDH